MRLYFNSKKLWNLIIIILLILSTWSISAFISPHKKKQPIAGETLIVEKFIQRNLQNNVGLIRTNITSRKDVYLSETVGLWLEYLVAKNDLTQFQKQIEVLKNYFLTDDYLVIWELQGSKKATANAFIDDLRIIDALFTAGKQWNASEYTSLAQKMSKQLISYQTVNNLMVDFIDLKEKTKGQDLTLSYIIPTGFEQMKHAGLLPENIYQETKNLLFNAPISELGFFPKKFSIVQEDYIFDQKVNLIDQLYTGYHLAKWGGNVSELLTFIKTAYSHSKGKLYGQYDGITGKPIVQYESPAVYALAILMCYEVGEDDFANKLYKRMKKLQYKRTNSPYNGGYIDVHTKETHTFDNLLALLAERRVLDEKDFRQ
ncbi:hypothetical protein [Bacillus massiliigorillae]|uniref:hypothetical protein n=1 Tax=Bacillus massiliigorillae TaxID=1243664 RepID=UPI00039DD93B|nr:hypothetical protein [Bacillus massiliigorillae]